MRACSLFMLSALPSIPRLYTGQPVTICHQFKLRAADGKMRLSDVADQEQLFRI